MNNSCKNCDKLNKEIERLSKAFDCLREMFLQQQRRLASIGEKKYREVHNA